MQVRSRPDPVERETPITYNRAVTELVQCRQHVVKAGDSLALALQIFVRLGGADQLPVQDLEEILGRLEEAPVPDL